MHGYGTTLAVGIGVPIPILNEEICRYTAIEDEDLWAPIVDYSDDYPNRKSEILGEINYAQLKSGKISIQGKEVPTGSISSYSKAIEIANVLKERIKNGYLFLNEPVAHLPDPHSGYTFKPLNERPF